MDITEIRENYNNGNYRVKVERPPAQLPSDYLFDEDMSVRRNRELVEEHNERVRIQKHEYAMQQAALDKKLTADIIEYVMDNYDLNYDQAVLVERHVYREKHAFMCDYFSYIDEFADFAEDIVRLTKPTT